MRVADFRQVVQHGGERATHDVAGQQVVLGGPAPQGIELSAQVGQLQGGQRVLSYANPVVLDPQRLGARAEQDGELVVIVRLGLVVVGPGPAVTKPVRAVDQADAARLALDPDPPPLLVLVGDDRHVVSDGGQAAQGLADTDQVTGQAGRGPYGKHVTGGSSQCRHSGHHAAHGRAAYRSLSAPRPSTHG